MKHKLDATLCRFYFCRVTLHVSGASAHHQEYLKLVRGLLVHVLSLQVSHHISLLWPEFRPGRTLPPGKTRNPLYRRLGGSQDRSGRAENLIPTGIRSRTVNPVVNCYTRDLCNNINFPEKNQHNDYPNVTLE